MFHRYERSFVRVITIKFSNCKSKKLVIFFLVLSLKLMDTKITIIKALEDSYKHCYL